MDIREAIGIYGNIVERDLYLWDNMTGRLSMFAELSFVLKQPKKKGVNEGNWFTKDSKEISSIIHVEEEKGRIIL